MQLKRLECMLQNKRYGFAAQANSKLSTIFNADRETSPPVPQVDTIKPDVPDQVANLDDLRIFVLEQTPYPILRALLRHRTQVVTAASIHPKYLGVGSKAQAGREIFFAGGPQDDPLAFED